MKPFRWMMGFAMLSGICIAQPRSSIATFGFSAGLDLPVFNESFRNYWQNANNYSVEVQLFLNQQFALCPRFGYHGFALDQKKLTKEFSRDVSGAGGAFLFEKGKRSLWEMGVQMQRYLSHPTDIVGFYLTLGGSYYQMIYEEARGVFLKDGQEYVEIIRDKVIFHGYGPQAGLGLEFRLHHRFCVISEAQLHYVMTSLMQGAADGGQVEKIFFHDSNKTAFITVLWGVRYQF